VLGLIAATFAIVSDVASVLSVRATVESARARAGPEAAAQVARQLGRQRRRRSATGRGRLRHAIGVVDAAHRDAGNCYRRALLEIATDAGAAEEELLLGFRSGGGAGSGHAWLSSQVPPPGYDVVVSL